MILNSAFRRLILTCGLVSTSIAAYSGGAELSPSSPNEYYLEGIGGISWIYSGKTNDINFGGLSTNRYVANSSSAAGPMLGVGFGYRWYVQSRYWVSLGIETSYTSATSQRGVVRPLYFISPNFDTLKFNYTVRALPCLALSTWGMQIRSWFNPYLTVGLGVSWNRATNYNEIPSDPNASALPMRAMFTNHTQAQFAYALGLGLQFSLSQLVSLSVAYRYQNDGTAQFAATSLQTNNKGLSLGSIHAHMLLMKLSAWWTT